MMATTPDLLQYFKRKEELWWALRTRLLTDEEMEEVRQHDWRVTQTLQNVEYGGSKEDHHRRLEFQDALFKQYQMREMRKI